MQKWVCYFWPLLLSLPLKAQVYNVTRYSTDVGLIQSQVMGLMQDRYGYLWLGTHRGAAKFDGTTFYAYGVEDGLGSAFLSDLVEDESGKIWIATDGGLSHGRNGSFATLTTKDGLPENDLTCLLLDQQGDLWVGTNQQGLAILREDSLLNNPFTWSDSAHHGIRALCEDQQGRVWVGTLDGLYVKSPGHNELKAFQAFGLPANLMVLSLLATREGSLWIGTDQGVYRYHDEVLSYHDLSQTEAEDLRVYCMVEDRQGQLWLGLGNGILRFDGEAFVPLVSGDRLLNYQMTAAMLDQEGNLWFGTDGGGVRKITDGLFEDYAMEDGLASNLAKSFLEDSQGRIWISTKDRGINLYEQGKIVAHYTTQDGLGGNDIISSYQDREGSFWFASYNGSLTRYRNGQFTAYGEADGLVCNALYWVTEDRDGLIWVGTDNGVFVRRKEKFYRELYQGQDLEDNTIYNLLFDQAGRMWLGSSAGLSLLEDGKMRNWIGSKEVGANVITIQEDPWGRIWFGSSVGLSFFSEGKMQVLKISGASGAGTVVGLNIEKNRWLWVATENGAYRLDLKGFQPDAKARFEHYTQKDGLPSLECNANAIFQDSRGALWIGTAEGAIRRPQGAQQRGEVVTPQVYITQVRGSQDSSWESQGYLVGAFDLPRSLELAYTENRLDFSFIGVSLRASQQVEYRFMMEGVDDDWQRPTRQTSVFYPNLDPGAYTFKVMAKLETEQWDDDNVDTFSFSIAPPFWQTWWFTLLLLGALLMMGYVVYDNVMSRRRRYQEQRRLQNAAEKLQLEHQALYAMMNPHFTFNALQSIQYFIHRQDRKSANKFLSSFAKLVRKNLESTKVDFISLAEEVERLKLYMSLEKMRFPEKFDFQVEVEPGLDLSETQLPPMMLQPFVENSIKHGIMPLESDGLITVAIAQQDQDYLRILIQDNGIGIEASRQRRANRPSDHVSQGMQITKDRLALFARITGKAYTLDIFERKSNEGEVEGTTVAMILPIREEVSL